MPPVRLRSCSVSLSLPLPGLRGPFLSSLHQSLELYKGVNHYSLDLLITARLQTHSSAAAFRLPTPASQQSTSEFCSRPNKTVHFPSRKKTIEQKVNQNIVAVFSNLVKSRVLVDFLYCKSIDDFVILECIWCCNEALCSLFEGE